MSPEAPCPGSNEITHRIGCHLERVYSKEEADELTQHIVDIMEFNQQVESVKPHSNLWDEQDIIVITYGDSIKKDGELPLITLQNFLRERLQGTISTVHILPFYPFSSDDGFSVINYAEVNQSLGQWEHVHNLSKEFDIMADLVINHCSSRSLWFDNFKQCKDPGKDYFIEADPDDDLSQVVRPRTSPLLRETDTLEGKKYVWCTFSHDQVDLNYANPKVLLEIIRVIKLYIDQGVSLFRLDAIAFLWKDSGTRCINLPQTHELIRLMRLVIEHYQNKSIVITETNIPNRENLSYFGNANEAHWIYNFTLPPIIVYTLLYGKSDRLKRWMMGMPPAQNGTAYFNFIASHDGIGLRPVEGILDEDDVDQMAALMRQFGGDVSWRTLPDGTQRPYEFNISLIDAFQGTCAGKDEYQLDRFVCAHAIMLGLEGVPAFYIHSLMGTHNDHNKVDTTGNKRSINRHNWDYDALVGQLDDPGTLHHQVFLRLSQLIHLRKQQPAFHPNATQFTMHFGESLFAFWRQSQDRRQSIFCIYNVTNQAQSLPLRDVNLVELDDWHNLVRGREYIDPESIIELAPYEFVWITNYKSAT